VLRIVPQDLFDKVQELITPKKRTQEERSSMKRPQRMLSGLIRCAACGGGMSVKGKDKSDRYRIVCSRHRDCRACPDPQTLYLDKVEQTVVDALRRELAHPKLLVDYVKAYTEARIEFASKLLKRRAKLETRIKELDVELDKVLTFIAKGMGEQDKVEQRYADLSFELQDAKAELALEPQPLNAVSLHPAAIKAYKESLDHLADAINNRLAAGYHKIGEALRELVYGAIVRRGEAPGQIEITLQGKLRALLSQPVAKSRVGGSMVAKEGFEPPTQGL
jgi:site-specific DNA recombinase